MTAQSPTMEQIEASIIELLREEEVGALSTMSPDGFPNCATMHFAGDGLAVYFSTYTYTRRYDDILANPHVSYALAHLSPVGFDGRDETRAIQIKGIATVVTNQSEIDHAVEVSLEQFPWARDFGMFDNYQREGVAHRQAFIRVDPVSGMWTDNRVHMLFRQVLEFTPDGQHLAATAPYDDRRGEPVAVDRAA